MCSNGVGAVTTETAFSEQRTQASGGDRLRSYLNLGSCCPVALTKSFDLALPGFVKMLVTSGLSTGSGVVLIGMASDEHLAWVLAHGVTREWQLRPQLLLPWKGQEGLDWTLESFSVFMPRQSELGSRVSLGLDRECAREAGTSMVDETEGDSLGLPDRAVVCAEQEGAAAWGGWGVTCWPLGQYWGTSFMSSC